MAAMSIVTGPAYGCDYQITLQGTGGVVRLPPSWLHEPCTLGRRTFDVAGAECTRASYDVSRAVVATVEGVPAPRHDILRLDLQSTSRGAPPLIFASASRGSTIATSERVSLVHRIELGTRKVEHLPQGEVSLAPLFYS